MDSRDQLLLLCDQFRSHLHFPPAVRLMRVPTETYTPQEYELFTLRGLVRHSPFNLMVYTSYYDPGDLSAYYHYGLHQTQFDIDPSALPIDQDQGQEDSVDDDDDGDAHAL
ncbi:hypothetical protein AXF42_Ash019380 [Apostasia shenzhenica]|uniref:Uncharacterized protein n=1 Tax=Apostasia shenzhenica TaxID=1088818 RepID=A0A2H9ZTL9_9ASPA|nr:hypothetical protein AXF42_Ash019380 [Apostasia shenzhenica]